MLAFLANNLAGIFCRRLKRAFLKRCRHSAYRWATVFHLVHYSWNKRFRYCDDKTLISDIWFPLPDMGEILRHTWGSEWSKQLMLGVKRANEESTEKFHSKTRFASNIISNFSICISDLSYMIRIPIIELRRPSSSPRNTRMISFRFSGSRLSSFFNVVVADLASLMRVDWSRENVLELSWRIKN